MGLELPTVAVLKGVTDELVLADSFTKLCYGGFV